MNDVTHIFRFPTGDQEDPIYGCTNPLSSNYDPNATIDDNSCIPPGIVGCMDPDANNFDEDATEPCENCCTYEPPAEPNWIDIYCSTYTKTAGILYAPGKFFDSYVENCTTQTNRPVIIMLHPGGGDRESFTPVKYCKEFASRGYFAISADFDETGGGYTLAKQKAAVAYMSALIRHLRANAVLYGINPNAIFMGGESKGALTAVTTNAGSNEIDNDVAYWDNPINAQDSGFSSVPTATFSQSGTMTPSLYDYITIADKKHKFYHGKNDCTMPYSQATCGSKGALECYNKMIAVGLPATLVAYNGLGHGIGSKHDEIMLGGGLQIDGVTVDAGIVADFAALIP